MPFPSKKIWGREGLKPGSRMEADIDNLGRRKKLEEDTEPQLADVFDSTRPVVTTEYQAGDNYKTVSQKRIAMMRTRLKYGKEKGSAKLATELKAAEAELAGME